MLTLICQMWSVKCSFNHNTLALLTQYMQIVMKKKTLFSYGVKKKS